MRNMVSTDAVDIAVSVQQLEAQQRKLSVVYGRLDWHASSAADTPDEWRFIQILQTRKADSIAQVDEALRPAERHEIKIEVSRLLSAYPTLPDAQKASFGALLAQDMLQLGVSLAVMREAFYETRRSEQRLCSATVLSKVDVHTKRLTLFKTQLKKLPEPRFDYLSSDQ